MKFALLVEGFTEKRVLPSFLKRWLDPRLSQPTTVEPANLRGAGEYRRHVASRARALAQTGEYVGIIGILDLYSSGLAYPVAKSVP